MKGIYLGNNFDINYVAEFVEIKEFKPHSNPEVTKLKCCKVHGFNVITNIDSKLSTTPAIFSDITVLSAGL